MIFWYSVYSSMMKIFWKIEFFVPMQKCTCYIRVTYIYRILLYYCSHVPSRLYCIGILFESTDSREPVIRFNNTRSYRFTTIFQLYKLFTVLIIPINIILFYLAWTMSRYSSSAVWRVHCARSDWFRGTLFYALVTCTL